MIDIPLGPLVLLFVLTLVLSGYFSATEAAFLSVQRHRIRNLAERGSARAKRVSRLAGHPEQFLPTILVGNNLVNTAAATLGALIALELFDNEGVAAVISAIVVAAVLIIFGETIPKTLGTRRAEATAMAFSVPLGWVEKALLPLIFPLRVLNSWVAKRLGGDRTASMVSGEELKVLISLNRESGSIDETEASMLLRTMLLADLKLRDVMAHRIDVAFVTDDMTVGQFLEFNSRQYYSRFPVYRQGTDQVIGVLAARDVLRALGASTVAPADAVGKLVRPTTFYWESKPAIETLTEMRRDGVSMGMVIDEFGATVGLVTFHQLLQELVGRSYGRRATQALQDAEGGGYMFKGSTRIHEINDMLSLALPEGDYDTVAGFVMSRLGHIPKVGDSVTHNDWKLTVTAARGPRVDQIRLNKVRAGEAVAG